MGKYIELWMKNVFDEWKLFYGFDITKFIVNLFEDEGLIKILVYMLSSFVLQITKKMLACILQLGIVLYHFLNVFIIRFLFFHHVFFPFCFMYASSVSFYY